MAEEEFDIGSLLTGPVPNISPTAASALLSFGLQAMQPVGIGQTPLGAFGQSVGAAGETITRQDVMDQKEALAQNKIAQAEQKLQLAQQSQDTRSAALGIRERMADIAQQNANTRATKKVGGLTDIFRARMDQTARNAWERDIAGQAARIAKRANDILPLDATDPMAKYKGKTEQEIREDLKKAQPYRGTQYSTGGGASVDDDEDDEDGPTIPGARGTPGAPPTPPPAKPSTQIPPASVSFLKANANDPSIRQQFDMMYGSGAAQQILGR